SQPISTAKLTESLVVQPLERSRGLAIAVVAAALTVIMLGGVVWLAALGRGNPPANEPEIVTPSSAPTEVDATVGAVGQFSQTSEFSVWGMSDTPIGILAIGSYRGGSAVFRSADAVTWSVVEETYTVTDQALVGVAGSNLGYVVAAGPIGGDDGGFWFSADGAEWAWVPVSWDQRRYDQVATAVAASDFGFVVVGFEGVRGRSIAWFSPDGQTWTQVLDADDDDDSTRNANYLFDVDYSEEYGFVAVGELGSVPAIWWSSDGISWTMTRPDGQQQDQPVEGVMFGVAASERGVVIGGGRDGEQSVWYSLDGNSWIRSVPLVEIEDGFHYPIVSTVAASSQGFIAAGGVSASKSSIRRPVMWYSTDGQTWNQVPPDDTVIIADDRWAWMDTSVTLGSKFVASGGGVWTFTPPES
ncbi:MAG: hypothetical protein DRJ28_07890, partial [Actinobacteria bacterium]